MSFREARPYGGEARRHVVVVGRSAFRCDIWQGGRGEYRRSGVLVLWRGGEDYTRIIPPPHVAAAFEAGEDILPLLDWLAEQHADAHPWLHDLARAAVTP